ncbi:MAG: RNA polymerase sigma factor [Casimicrobium sp.]
MSSEDDSTLSDAELFERCRQGNRRAWESFVRRFQKLIYTVARRAGLGDDQAADVFQTVFSRVYENMHKISQPERIQAWLVTTAKRETIALVNRNRKTVSITSFEDEDGEQTFDIEDEGLLPDEQLEQLQLQRELKHALETLDPKLQEFARLVFLQDEPMPYSEVAARLGISEGSIGPTRARVLEKIRAAMEKNI